MGSRRRKKEKWSKRKAALPKIIVKKTFKSISDGSLFLNIEILSRGAILENGKKQKIGILHAMTTAPGRYIISAVKSDRDFSAEEGEELRFLYIDKKLVEQGYPTKEKDEFENNHHCC